MKFSSLIKLNNMFQKLAQESSKNTNDIYMIDEIVDPWDEKTRNTFRTTDEMVADLNKTTGIQNPYDEETRSTFRTTDEMIADLNNNNNKNKNNKKQKHTELNKNKLPKT